MILEDHYLSRTGTIKYFAYLMQKEFYSINPNEITIKLRLLTLGKHRFHDSPVSMNDFLSILEALEMKTAFETLLMSNLMDMWNFQPGFSLDIVNTSSTAVTLSKICDSHEPIGHSSYLVELSTFVFNQIFSPSHWPSESFIISWLAIIKKDWNTFNDEDKIKLRNYLDEQGKFLYA